MLMLKKRHSAVTASAITLLPRSRHPWKGGIEESAVNRGTMIEPGCLIDEEGTVRLFPDGFVGHGKWFRDSWLHPDEER
jgi:hypothetical protein